MAEVDALLYLPGHSSEQLQRALIAGQTVYYLATLELPAPGNVLVCCSQPDAGVTLDL